MILNMTQAKKRLAWFSAKLAIGALSLSAYAAAPPLRADVANAMYEGTFRALSEMSDQMIRSNTFYLGLLGILALLVSLLGPTLWKDSIEQKLNAKQKSRYAEFKRELDEFMDDARDSLREIYQLRSKLDTHGRMLNTLGSMPAYRAQMAVEAVQKAAPASPSPQTSAKPITQSQGWETDDAGATHTGDTSS